LRTEGEYNTLELTASAREVLRGDIQLLLRRTQAPDARTRGPKAGKPPRSRDKAALSMSADGLQRFEALKAWRAEVAREHNLPAYIVFHDATLAEMARSLPDTLDALGQISGVGAKKLEAYGDEILRVLSA